MSTDKQTLGDLGEKIIAETMRCPQCKREERTLRTMPPNFKCVDIVCDFCGFLAQVKSKTVKSQDLLHPPKILGASWGPQKARMDAGIYFSLYIVAIDSTDSKNFAIYFLPSELQTKEMFVPRTPLAASAKRAGWQGFMIDVAKALGQPVRIK